MTETKARPKLPTIDDVQDLPQNPAFPPGYNSDPDGPGALVASLGLASVIAFASSYSWATTDYGRIAHNWVKNTVNRCAWAATLRDYAAVLTEDQKNSLQLSCVSAGAFFGSKYYLPLAYAYVLGRATVHKGCSFPANFSDTGGLSGQTTSEKGPADAKQMAFDSLIRDIRQGILTPAERGEVSNELPSTDTPGHELPSTGTPGHDLPSGAKPGHDLPSTGTPGHDLPSGAKPGHELPHKSAVSKNTLTSKK